MAKPLTNVWTDAATLADVKGLEAQIGGLPGSVGPYKFHMARDRGGRGKYDPGVVGITVGAPGNPIGSGTLPNPSPFFRDDSIDFINDGRLISFELNCRFTSEKKGNMPILWRDVYTNGWYDQIIFDKVAEANFQQFLAHPSMGHMFELGSEVNIHHSMGGAQPPSWSTDALRYTEYANYCRYFIELMEGARPSAAGLGFIPTPVPHGKIKWTVSLGQQQYHINEPGAGGRKQAEFWMDGLEDHVDIFGADGYVNPGETAITYQSMFEPVYDMVVARGYQTGNMEFGVSSDLGAAAKSDKLEEAWDFIRVQNRDEVYVVTFTSFQDDTLTQPIQALTGFRNGWQAYLDTPDDEPPPPPPPPPPGYIPGIIAPWKKVALSAD